MQSSKIVLPILRGTVSLRVGSCALLIGLLPTIAGCSGAFLRGGGSQAVVKSYPTETATTASNRDKEGVLPTTSFSHTEYYPPQPIEKPLVASPPTAPEVPGENLSQDEAVALYMADLKSAGQVQPGTEERLASQLRASDRKLWPLVVEQHRSAVAYSQELLAKERRQLAAMSNRSRHQFPPVNSSRPDTPGALATPALASPALAGMSSQESPLGVPPSTEARQQTSLDSEGRLSTENHPLVSAPSANLAEVSPHETGSMPNTQSPQTLPQPMHQASYQAHTSAREDQTLGWREHLEASLAELERSIPNEPGSTDELQEHMRLRMLRLMARQTEAAYEPIPGASATQQDYWSKQLFAVSTFLDSEQIPDNKQRAAGSLKHLDQARAKLAELASLQVRSATFVTKVDGYGMYEPKDSSKFRPGDQVTIYAEVENFRSESTKDGYRTALSTSYEIVDPHDRRIDGAQFPEVEDYCKKVRRDFHMQYGVALPTRIYPGEYQLRLVITDQLSNKIGQAVIPFEIVD